MNTPAIIWRESVYKNGFKCNECGAQIADSETGEPLDNTPFSPLGNFLFCPSCLNPVAQLEVVDVSEDVQGLQGDYEDFRRKQKRETNKVSRKRLRRLVQRWRL